MKRLPSEVTRYQRIRTFRCKSTRSITMKSISLILTLSNQIDSYRRTASEDILLPLYRSAPDQETALVGFATSFYFYKILLNLFFLSTGQKFATYEDKVVLTTLMRKYRFDIDPRHYPIKESLKMVLKTENGMPLLITSR